MGPESEIVGFSSALQLLFEGPRPPRADPEELRISEPDRLGGGRGRVNPPPRRLVWRFWEVWRVGCWVRASTRLEARGLGGFSKHAKSSTKYMV